MEEPSIPYNYTTFLDKSGKLIKKTGYFFLRKIPIQTTFNRENFTSKHK